VGQFEISLSKDCQVCHIELVEMLSKPGSETRSPSTSSGWHLKNFKLTHYRMLNYLLFWMLTY